MKNEDAGTVPQGAQESTCDILCYEIKQLKWRILAVACFLTFGSYYIYDFPGALGTAQAHSIEALFESKGKKYTQADNLALYSVYSWPNVILAFFGGILIDNVLGLRRAMLLFTTLVAIGAAVFWVGVISTNYPLMLFGRFIFGLGGESLSVSQSAFVARWFRQGRGLALAFGITISFSRVGSSVNFACSPRIAKAWNVQWAVLFGVIACGISLLSCVVLMIADLYGEKHGLVLKEEIKKASTTDGGFVAAAKEWFQTVSRDVKGLGAKFWLICVICVTVYCALFPLIGVAANFFQIKYDMTHDHATTTVSYFQFACAGFSPLVGGLVDRVGRFSSMMIFAGTGFTLIHLVFVVASPPPLAMMIVMGVVYSFLASSLWPAVPYVVDPTSVGLAYGVMTAMQNAGLAVYPLASGAILDYYTPSRSPVCEAYKDAKFPNITVNNTREFPPGSLIGCQNNTDSLLPVYEGYRDTELLFMFTALAGVLVGIVLLILDFNANRVLFSNASDRKQIMDEEEAQAKRLLADTATTESAINP